MNPPDQSVIPAFFTDFLVLEREYLTPLRACHLSYIEACWKDCLILAERLIGKKSDDSVDQDVRQGIVFDFSLELFRKYAPSVSEFIGILELIEHKQKQEEEALK